MARRKLCGLLLGWACGWGVGAQAQPLPEAVKLALAQAKVPLDAVSFVVVDAQGDRAPRLAHRAHAPMNPASVMKLVTTYAALDVLGPAFVWRTPVLVQGRISQGVLHGNLYIQGQGDPKLVVERLWLLLRQVQGLGIQTIAGDIVLDNTAFASPLSSPADFDGEPLRPYNVAPEALLLNFKSVLLTLLPLPDAPVARVLVEPPLAGVQFPAQVDLDPTAAVCGDYAAHLQADFSDPLHVRFAGSYPQVCGAKTWTLAFADPASYKQRLVLGLWQAIGGRLEGQVRLARLPESVSRQAPTLQAVSPPLAELIRDINKFSNNVMAQQLFLTLGLQAAQRQEKWQEVSGAAQVQASVTFEAARAELQRWWQARLGTLDPPVFDNGAGLSRQERISAAALAHLLQVAYRSPYRAELTASLPRLGVDGTLTKHPPLAVGHAHLKTGSLRDVSAWAGYVTSSRGRHYVFVALANHDNARLARAAFDALLNWTVQDDPDPATPAKSRSKARPSGPSAKSAQPAKPVGVAKV